MYHNILTNKESTDDRRIKKAVKRLRMFIKADLIYFSKQSGRFSASGIITVIISKSSPHYYEEIHGHCWKIFKHFEEFTFRFFDRFWVNEEIENGNPYFILRCNDGTLIYSRTKEKRVFEIAEISAEDFLRSAGERFDADKLESDAIGCDLKSHMREGNHLMSAYAIHKYMRYLFMNVSWFLTGEDNPSQNIVGQLIYLSRFSDRLGNPFNHELTREFSVLEQLECVRESVQNNQKIVPVTEEHIESALLKLDWLKIETDKLFRDCIEKTKQIFENYENN